MKLNYDKKSKDPIYYVQMGIRNGKKTTTKNVFRIGKHSDLLKVVPDPLAYAKEVVEKYNQEYAQEKTTVELKINFAEKLKATKDVISKSTSSNIGYFFLQQIYYDLDISSFLSDAVKNSKITYDPNLINRFLVISRILNPDSKLGTLQKTYSYYEKPEFSYEQILRTLDILENNYDGYLEHLYEASSKVVKRDTSVCYYDCTNYYFETESPDEEYTDPRTGEVLPGLRRYGYSKEHRPNPLVQMGLFMDRDGIPLSMCITPGNQNEQTTALPAEKKLTKMLNGKKLIYCADAGLGSYSIRNFNTSCGRAFVITQSIKKLTQVLQDAVFSDCDYRLLSSNESTSIEFLSTFDADNEENLKLYNDFAYKVLTADKALDLGLTEEVLENGKKKKLKKNVLLPQKIIVTFSRKMMEYQKHIRECQVERARALLESKDPETIKKGPNDIRRFIKRNSKSKSEDSYTLDQDLIDYEAKFDGYYAVATNLDDDVKTVLDICSDRYKIEDCFRLMKTNLSARPVFHHKRERIIAHFMVCYTALLIYRILEKKLNDYGTHFTIDNIIETLQNMNVANVEDICYLSTYTASNVCTALNGIFDLGLDKKYYQAKELNKIIKKISK